MVFTRILRYCHGGIFYQILMTMLINLPLVSFGLTMGWLSPNAQLLQSEATPAQAPLPDVVVSWMASVSFLAAAPAMFAYWWAADVLGRKPALLATSVPFAICWTLKLCSMEAWVLILARAIAGLGSSGCFIVAPLYVKEISQDSIRGALGSVVILAQNLGYLMAYIISDYLAYRTVLWICLSVSLLHIVVFVFMPESPSFLMSRNRMEDAAKSLGWLRGRSPEDKRVQDELAVLQKQEKEVMSTKMDSLRSIVSDKITFRAFRMALVLVLAQEVCGVFTLLMYAGRILSAAGEFGVTANLQTTLLGAAQLAGSLLAACAVERVGRKPLLAGSAYVVSLCMLVLGVWFYLNEGGAELPRWPPVLAMGLAVFCDSGGIGPVPLVIMSELFTFELRAMVATAIMGASDLANFAELKVFHPIINNMGMHTCFFVFTAISFSFGTYTVLFVPETKGKTVEEIFENLRNKDKKYAHNTETNAGGSTFVKDERSDRTLQLFKSNNDIIHKHTNKCCRGTINDTVETYKIVDEENKAVFNIILNNETNDSVNVDSTGTVGVSATDNTS